MTMLIKHYQFPLDWDNTTKISFLQRRVIVHSILYYEMSTSVISDVQFDVMSRQLVALMQSSTKEECEKSTYWYCMSTFDASTGFYIYSRLNARDKWYLRGIAAWMLDSYRKYVKWGENDDAADDSSSKRGASCEFRHDSR